MDKISFSEQKSINEIIYVSKMITSIYQRLFLLEMDLTCDVDSYNNLCQQLKGNIEKEQKLYEELELTPERTSRLREYLHNTEKRFKMNENNVLTAIYNTNSENLYIYRIINQLQNRIFKNDKEWEDWLMSNNAFHANLEAKKYISFRRFDEAIENDFETAFYSYLEDKIRSSNTDKEKDYFGKIKYTLLSISSSSENLFLNDSLDYDSIYFSHPLVAEYHKIPKNVSDNLLFMASRDYCAEVLNNALIKNELVNKDFELEFMALFIYMKSSISLIFPFEDYDYLMESLKDEIQSLNDTTNNDLSITSNILISQIDNIKNEKSKCKYLHFIPPK